MQILALQPASPEIAICAKWRIEAFGDVLGKSLEEDIDALKALAADEVDRAILFAACDGAPAGTCLLVPRELEPCHPVSPWLAGLFVAPAFRRRGIGRHLVHAIEDEARARGHGQIFLYTDEETKPYYEALGWRAGERFHWKGLPTLLMTRRLTRYGRSFTKR